MSYRWARFLLTLLGLIALAGFGLAFSDFVRNKVTYLAPFDPRRLQSSIKEYSSQTLFGHLKAHDPHFQVVHYKPASGWVKPSASNSGELPPPPPPPKVGPNDVEVSLIQYSSDQAYAAAYLRPVSSQNAESRYVGEFYRVNEVFQLEGKEGVDLKVLSIAPDLVEIGIVDGDFSFSIVPGEADKGEDDRVQVLEIDSDLAQSVAPSATQEISPDIFFLGTEDLKAVKDMPEDELYAAVPVTPAKDATGEIRGLRIKSVLANTVFSRMGLRAGDVVLEINGFPAKDRAAVLQFLRNQNPGTSIFLMVERFGGIRNLTYQLPR